MPTKEDWTKKKKAEEVAQKKLKSSTSTSEFSSEVLQQLSRKELVSLAKQYGVKGNIKSVEMVKELSNIFITVELEKLHVP